MKEISFKNFRRFSDFPAIEFGDLNLLVGANNSGKSTAIKATLLALKNILRINLDNDPPLESFSFLNDLEANTHFGDFLSNIPKGSQDKTMEFCILLLNYRIKFYLDGSSIKKDGPALSVPLKRLEIWDTKSDCTLTYDNTSKPCTKSFSISKSSIQKQINIEAKYRIDIDTDVIHNIIDAIDCDTEDYITVALRNKVYASLEGCKVVHRLFYPYEISDDKHLFTSESLDQLDRVLSDMILLFRDQFVLFYDLEYIETHCASHNEVLYESDRNNYLARTVAQYENAYITSDDKAYSFIKKWLTNFNIGNDFKITRPFAEVLKVDILTNNGYTPLGSIGTGSIQLFILLLRIAIAIKNGNRVIFFIEEPEQNLHPAFQSKLADLFHEAISISRERIQFVIETHSEYLVRRTQVIVAEGVQKASSGESPHTDIDFWNHRFKVYYFPENDIPYSMDYRSNGQFEHPFGAGFYDEAGKNYRALLKPSI